MLGHFWRDVMSMKRFCPFATDVARNIDNSADWKLAMSATCYLIIAYATKTFRGTKGKIKKV
jgi:hypothetical protein